MAAAPDDTVLVTPAEVAARLAVSRTWVYAAANAGRIPSIRVGGENGPLRFAAQDIERWLADARATWVPGQPPVATRTPVEQAATPDQRDGM